MTDLLKKFVKHVEAILEPRGVFPHVALWRLAGENKLNMAAIAINEPDQVLGYVLDRLINEPVEELVFGLDRYSKPGQGVSTKDFLCVYHYLADEGWLYGVLEYQYKPRIFKPIHWRHPVWAEIMAGDVEHAAGRIVFKKELEDARQQREAIPETDR